LCNDYANAVQQVGKITPVMMKRKLVAMRLRVKTGAEWSLNRFGEEKV